MLIIVCVKQVPDSTDVKSDPETGRIMRDGVPSIVNPDDRHAVEAAVRLKEQTGAEVVLLTMGPPQAKSALKEMLAMGADRAILLTDSAFAGADTYATAFTLGLAIRKLGSPHVIFCGRQAIDGDTAQVGPQLAEFLGIPQVTHVKELAWEDPTFAVSRALDEGHYALRVVPPVLFSVVSELNQPRYPSMKEILLSVRKKKIELWDAKMLEADPLRLGLNGSPTQVKRVFAPTPPSRGEQLTGDMTQMVEAFVERVMGLNVVQR